ncbi:MAG: phospholipase D-like domain-containing protein [Jatrophihabitans sp.]
MHQYFPAAEPGCPTFAEDSEWHPLVDGEGYFNELDRLLAELGVGDEILIAGLALDPELDLRGRRSGAADYESLADRLVAAGAAGTDVRVLVAGKVTASFIPLPGLAIFRANAALVRRLDQARPKGWPPERRPPLEGHALVDYSGVLLGSNHQKTVVVTQGGVVTAFVGGIDFVASRYDAAPHDRLSLDGERWGWHDAAVRLCGPAAARAHDAYLERWHEAATLPPKPYLKPRIRLPRINPPTAPAPAPAVLQQPVASPGTSVRVLRSVSDRKLDSLFPWRRHRWDAVPQRGIHEIYETVVAAIRAARRYVYIEDQYLCEYAGRRPPFELYPHLRDAAARGVKLILVGSGTRDPEDPGINVRPINRRVNRDIRTKIIDQLDADRRGNVVLFRIEHATVHAKLIIVDDVFANIGSANLFSRSMSGVDCEISAAVATSTSLVRDLRIQVWGEHLRAPLTRDLKACLADLDLALGIWNAAWLPADRPRSTWRTPGEPGPFAPAETVLQRVDVPR